MQIITMAILAMSSVLWFVRSGYGQTPEVFEDQHLLAKGGNGGDTFSSSVSLSGDVAVVGAPWGDTVGGLDAGLAYVYRYDSLAGWVEEDHLIASDGSAHDWFGYSVALSGEVAVVGAIKDDTTSGTDAGSVYVFRYDGTTWVEEAILIATDGATENWFGYSVSLGGDSGNEVAVIGSLNDNTATGSVYIYRFNGMNWVEESHLVASDAATSDQFGFSVSVCGNSNSEIAIIGAYTDDTPGGSDAGSAYVFRNNGVSWVEESHLIALDTAANDQFGFSVSVSGAPGCEVVLIGARDDGTVDGNGVGSAYVYRFNGMNWVEESHLFASDGAVDDWFGYSVSINGYPGSEIAVISAVLDDTIGGTDSGSAYVFRFDGTNWVEVAHLFASDGASSDLYGFSVSISGDVTMVGAINDDTASGIDAGSVYGYITLFDCNNNGIIDFDDITSGFSQDANANDFPDECECLADISPIIIGGPIGNGIVNIDDLVTVLNAFGQSTPPGQPTVLGDINYNGVVNIDDLVALLNAFGPCP